MTTAEIRHLDGAKPPSNIDTEQALLGCLLFDNGAYSLLGGTLKAEHFFEGLHQRLFAAIEARVLKGQLADPFVLRDRFANDHGFEEMGGIRYLADLVDKAPPVTSVTDYAASLLELWAGRTFLQITMDSQRAVRIQGGPVSEVIAALRTDMDALEASAAPEDATMISAPDAAEKALAAMKDRAENGKTRGKRTGLRCFDRRLGGLRPGTLLVIGGRPGMGKTSLARACAHGAAVHNPHDLFLFLGIEMDPEEMMQRELSALSFEHGEFGDGVEYRAMGSGDVTPMDIASVDGLRSRVPQNLILDDCASLSVDDVRRKLWALKRRQPVGAVFIDYLQLMRRPRSDGRNESSVIGEMTQALKQIARQSRVCIVLLSQLSRQVEHRDDKRPQLADLRESGSIEQDADAVLFPYREFYYVERAEPKAGSKDHTEWEMRCADLRQRLDVICAKQRQGPIGTDRQTYQAGYDFITDYKE